MSHFGTELRRMRNLKGLSQLALSLEADVSTRHVSFLETGRSEPSRGMVKRLGVALDLPLRARNHLLMSAGYLPQHTESNFDESEMGPIRDGLEFLLASHDPYPAFVLNRHWQIVMSNRSHRAMLAGLFAGEGADAEEPHNALRLVFSPNPVREAITNWDEVVRVLVPRVEAQVKRAAGDPEIADLLQEIKAYPGVLEALSGNGGSPGVDETLRLLVPLNFELGGQTFSWYTTIAGFGGAVDVTTQEAVIEMLLPADEETKRAAHAFVSEVPV